MAKCIETLKVCQGANERQDYAFNVTDELAIRWQANRTYQTGQTVRPNELPGTGYEYVATVADSSGGMSSGAAEPTWPKTLGGTVVDGSVTWTAQIPTFDGLRDRIDTVSWDTTSETGDLLLTDPVEQDLPGLQEVRIWVSGGTLGETYDCWVLITTESGAIYECRLEVTII